MSQRISRIRDFYEDFQVTHGVQIFILIKVLKIQIEEYLTASLSKVFKLSYKVEKLDFLSTKITVVNLEST